ncbi:hypothetical protein I7I48_02208 [Histoplasma ohiense]|nr:hypothetical protein I7I48_02208 [Histoplasma ohiense (nom. inval.)]
MVVNCFLLPPTQPTHTHHTTFSSPSPTFLSGFLFLPNPRPKLHTNTELTAPRLARPCLSVESECLHQEPT